MIRLDFGLEAIEKRLLQFAALIQASASNRIITLSCADPAALANLLAEIQRDIDDADVPANEDYITQYPEAGIDAADLSAIPIKTKAEQQLDRVQSGDICELIGCLVLATVGGFLVHELHPKNLIKINPRYSERGLDIICLSLEDVDSDGLRDADRLLIVEAKSSTIKGTHGLHSDAVTSNKKINADSLKRELRLLKSQRQQREGPLSKFKRIKHFLTLFDTEDSSLSYGAVLASSSVDNLSAEVSEDGPFSTIYTTKLDIANLCSVVYRHLK